MTIVTTAMALDSALRVTAANASRMDSGKEKAEQRMLRSVNIRETCSDLVLGIFILTSTSSFIDAFPIIKLHLYYHSQALQ